MTLLLRLTVLTGYLTGREPWQIRRDIHQALDGMLAKDSAA